MSEAIAGGASGHDRGGVLALLAVRVDFILPQHNPTGFTRHRFGEMFDELEATNPSVRGQHTPGMSENVFGRI